jgi:hypothetical protein
MTPAPSSPKECEACDILRSHGPTLIAHLTLGDTPLCGFHASELQKENAALRERLARAEREIGRLRTVLTNVYATIDDLNLDRKTVVVRIATMAREALLARVGGGT